MIVLAINAGSSSLKAALFDHTRRLAHVVIDDVHDHTAALAAALDKLGGPAPDIAGHRVVHGGDRHVEPALVDDALLASLRELVPLAPLHMPASLAGIAAVSARLPGLTQFACFDTAFHAGMPDLARRLPLAGELDVRRYGFHGLSYEYVVSAIDMPANAIIAHLGNGASLVALAHGKPIDTTMGMTPAGGVVMGTRTGDLDPGVVIYLARRLGDIDAVERAVERDGGLHALAGTADMRALLARTDAAARFAVSAFAYSVRKAIGALAAALGGVDLLVFTGGIGEHAPAIRALACGGLAHLGIGIDDARNQRNDAAIGNGPCAVRVIATDEELVIARHAGRFA